MWWLSSCRFSGYLPVCSFLFKFLLCNLLTISCLKQQAYIISRNSCGFKVIFFLVLFPLSQFGLMPFPGVYHLCDAGLSLCRNWSPNPSFVWCVYISVLLIFLVARLSCWGIHQPGFLSPNILIFAKLEGMLVIELSWLGWSCVEQRELCVKTHLSIILSTFTRDL